MLRVLIADDEDIIREGLKKLVERAGLSLTVIAMAHDGEEALKLFSEYRPEILLMDINMPLLNGLDAIAQLRRDAPEAKIIIVSGYNEFIYAQKALELGVFAYLLKPLDPANFREVLERACDAYKERLLEKSHLARDEAPVLASCQKIALGAVAYLQAHFCEGDLTLSDVAERFHISQSYLTRITKQKVGLTFTDYLGALRVDLAKTLLADDRDMTIAEVADRVGYSSQHYFSRAFKNYTGLTPGKFRAEKREEG
ncbi:MAG: response regulator [Clostridia bacterium]